MSLQSIIDEVIRVEGGYTNNINDNGGETKFGITVATARANGYTGKMFDLPVEFAQKVYYEQYIMKPGFDKVMQIAGEALAAELVDTGVNCGPATAATHLQRALNALNNCEKLYPNLVEDGGLGQKSMDALAAYVKARGQEGVRVLFVALNCIQAAYYMALSARNEKQETFMYGWLLNRVVNQLK